VKQRNAFETIFNIFKKIPNGHNQNNKQTVFLFPFGQNTLEDIKWRMRVKVDNQTGYKDSADNVDKNKKKFIKIHRTQSKLIAAYSGERAA